MLNNTEQGVAYLTTHSWVFPLRLESKSIDISSNVTFEIDVCHHPSEKSSEIRRDLSQQGPASRSWMVLLVELFGIKSALRKVVVRFNTHSIPVEDPRRRVITDYREILDTLTNSLEVDLEIKEFHVNAVPLTCDNHPPLIKYFDELKTAAGRPLELLSREPSRGGMEQHAGRWKWAIRRFQKSQGPRLRPNKMG